MKALISGEAARIVVFGKANTLFEANSEHARIIDAAEVHLLFGGCSDVSPVEVPSIKAAQQLVQDAWACDRALRLILFLFDPDDIIEELIEYAECAEELVTNDSVRDFVLKRLLSNELGQLVEVTRIFDATSRTPVVAEILKEVVSSQQAVKEVVSAFEKVYDAAFGGEQQKYEFRNVLVADGIFCDLARAFTEKRDISFLKLQLINKYRQYAEAITQWVAILQPGTKKIRRSSLAVTNDDTFESYDYSVRASDRRAPERGRNALENVLTKRHQVVNELKLGRLDKARELVDALVIEQQIHSKPEHIAKTLDALAQEAKELGAVELQLEWADRAYRVEPKDPLTSGHHADALICAGRISEAEQAIRRTEEIGNMTFAGNMRARILRLKGQYESARELYLKTAELYSDDPEIWRSFAGAVECLRDLNRLEEARREYEALVKRWPKNASLRSGLASTLMDAGNFPLAIKYYGMAIANNGGVIPKSGRANAYKLSGNYDEAIRLYDECAEEAPNSEAVFCGRAEVFRAKGDLEGALKAFELAIERAPLSVDAIVGKAEVLEDLKRLDDAAEIYNYGMSRFPEEGAFEIGLARLLRKTSDQADALAAFDNLIRKFPNNRWVAYSRADILRRLGNVDAALRAFDMLLGRWPDYGPAVNAKVSLLIDSGQLAKARESLRLAEPLSALDWRRVLLSAMLLKAEGNLEGALKILRDAAKAVPFVKERKLIKAALASFNLERGHYRAAARELEEGLSAIGNVIALHAYAVSNHNAQRERAATLLSEMMSQKLDADIIDLGREIARRFNIVPNRPEKTRQWISEREQSLLLREVA